MATMIATNWATTRARIRFCDLFGEPPRIMFHSPNEEDDENDADRDRHQKVGEIAH